MTRHLPFRAMTTATSHLEVADVLPIRQLRESVRGRSADDLVDAQTAAAVERAIETGASWLAISSALKIFERSTARRDPA